jgi:hypothetical protein
MGNTSGSGVDFISAPFFAKKYSVHRRRFVVSRLQHFKPLIRHRYDHRFHPCDHRLTSHNYYSIRHNIDTFFSRNDHDSRPPACRSRVDIIRHSDIFNHARLHRH